MEVQLPADSREGADSGARFIQTPSSMAKAIHNTTICSKKAGEHRDRVWELIFLAALSRAVVALALVLILRKLFLGE